VADIKQTDYGNIFFKQPTEIIRVTSTEDLARRLKGYHEKGERVTIRNTAHSTFGQTLTDGVQLDIGGIEGAKFDEGAKTVTAGAGDAWNAVFKAIGFPKYCTPIFPSNPGQHIQIGGTAAVGGVGYYGSHVGGFWNHVVSAKVVTMTGDIIPCSKTENFETLKYAISGFGRIGVMSELVVKVVESKPRVLCMALAYRDSDRFQEAFLKALKDPLFNGVAAQEDLSNWQTNELEKMGVNLKLLLVMVEMNEGEEPRAIGKRIREGYPADFSAYLEMKDRGRADVTLEPKTFAKETIVFFYPETESFWIYLFNRIALKLIGKPIFHPRSRLDFKNPWCDCIVSRQSYTAFVLETKRIISKYGMGKQLEKQSMFHGLINIDSFVTFGVRRASTDPNQFYPLALDLPDEPEHALGVAIMPSLPPDEPKLLEAALAMSNELTELVYSDSIRGRRYLYGYNLLTREQVEKHYGTDVLQKWQQIKDQFDPKHLLNIGVIPHLDD
jgi:FAD/FMN-containing dehydrogenase